jgi:hypothetical protein
LTQKWSRSEKFPFTVSYLSILSPSPYPLSSIKNYPILAFFGVNFPIFTPNAKRQKRLKITPKTPNAKRQTPWRPSLVTIAIILPCFPKIYIAMKMNVHKIATICMAPNAEELTTMAITTIMNAFVSMAMTAKIVKNVHLVILT